MDLITLTMLEKDTENINRFFSNKMNITSI